MTLKPNMLTPNPPDATARVIDPFHNDYNYLAPGTNNTATFDLWSTANANPPTDQLQWIKKLVGAPLCSMLTERSYKDPKI